MPRDYLQFYFRFFVLLAGLFSLPGSAEQPQAATRNYVVHLLIRPTPDNDYLTQLLRATLEASKQPGENIVLQFNDRDLSQARWIAELQKNHGNDLIWTVTNKEREQLLHAVKVPLLRGLYGYRLLVIRPESTANFAQVGSREALAKFTAGINAHWPDADIFRDNQLPMNDGTFAVNLYRMLAAQRFDYFPRGALEITEEQPLISAYGLTIEKTLLIYYPSVLYFFVSKDNVELAQRLEKGLAILQQQGEFDRLFYSHPAIVAALRAIHNRRIITLVNHQFPEDAQQFPPEYFRAQNQYKALQWLRKP